MSTEATCTQSSGTSIGNGYNREKSESSNNFKAAARFILPLTILDLKIYQLALIRLLNSILVKMQKADKHDALNKIFTHIFRKSLQSPA